MPENRARFRRWLAQLLSARLSSALCESAAALARPLRNRLALASPDNSASQREKLECSWNLRVLTHELTSGCSHKATCFSENFSFDILPSGGEIRYNCLCPAVSMERYPSGSRGGFAKPVVWRKLERGFESLSLRYPQSRRNRLGCGGFFVLIFRQDFQDRTG